MHLGNKLPHRAKEVRLFRFEGLHATCRSRCSRKSGNFIRIPRYGDNFYANENLADCPDVHKAHAQALALDEFCTKVDVMIGINIISRDGGALTGAKIRVLANSGFRLGAKGMFSYRDDNNTVLFTLTTSCPPFSPIPCGHTTHGITFLLDVPKVARGKWFSTIWCVLREILPIPLGVSWWTTTAFR